MVTNLTRNILEARHFRSTWNALAGRSTTEDADLYLIFANIHNLRTETLTRLVTFREKLRRIIFCGILPLLGFATSGDGCSLRRLSVICAIIWYGVLNKIE
jgi:hypothetical protein